MLSKFNVNTTLVGTENNLTLFIYLGRGHCLGKIVLQARPKKVGRFHHRYPRPFLRRWRLLKRAKDSLVLSCLRHTTVQDPSIRGRFWTLGTTGTRRARPRRPAFPGAAMHYWQYRWVSCDNQMSCGVAFNRFFWGCRGCWDSQQAQQYLTYFLRRLRDVCP